MTVDESRELNQMMTPYAIEKCNALGRALPKAWRRLTSARGPKADSPAWEEAYHVYEEATRSWHELRNRLNKEVEPWFDNSAFIAPTSTKARDGNG